MAVVQRICAGAGSFARHSMVRGSDIPSRCEALYEWAQQRLDEDTWSFCRTQLARDAISGEYQDWRGQITTGINFAAQDYLGLSQDERVANAVCDAVREFGVHGAGSEVNGGTTLPAAKLECKLGEHLANKHCILFPTGWAAGYGSIRGLVRKRDHVVIDQLAHNCLKEGALASGANTTTFDHNDLTSLADQLRHIRSSDTRSAILVVTESLFSMDADGPDLGQLIDIVHNHGAYLLLDCAHDYGVFGPKGKGLAAEAGVLDGVDFVVGSFSKTFATTGGFFASKWRQCTLFVQAYGQSNTFSNQLGPLQAAAALACFDIVTSPEGGRLTRATIDVATKLRTALEKTGLQCLGRPAPLIPILIGSEPQGREVTRRLGQEGILVNFIEFPAVALGASRLRLQIAPQHAVLDLQEIAGRIGTVVNAVRTGQAA